MTIRPGEPWGSEVARPSELLLAHTDADVVEAPAGAAVALAGGDLFRSLGAPDARDPMLRVEVDGLVVQLDDGPEMEAIAHVVIRRSWWRGAVIAAMNVDHLGDWNVAPRAHPNDGRFDVVEVSARMPLRHRWSARSRLRSGTHVPHPRIEVRRADSAEWTFERPHAVRLDGRRVGTARRVRVRLRPDRFVVHF